METDARRLGVILASGFIVNVGGFTDALFSIVAVLWGHESG